MALRGVKFYCHEFHELHDRPLATPAATCGLALRVWALDYSGLCGEKNNAVSDRLVTGIISCDW